MGSWAESPAAASRWGHYAPHIFGAIIASAVLMSIVPPPVPLELRPLMSIAIVALMVATMVENRRHDRGMCEVCVSEMPLNPAQAAESKLRRLTFVHLVSERQFGMIYLSFILGAMIVPFLVPSSLRIGAFVISTSAAASVAYLMLSQATHRRLQPWCPLCGDQGGSGVDQETPAPIDSLSG
jgi:uncharacterized membrane protein